MFVKLLFTKKLCSIKDAQLRDTRIVVANVDDVRKIALYYVNIYTDFGPQIFENSENYIYTGLHIIAMFFLIVPKLVIFSDFCYDVQIHRSERFQVFKNVFFSKYTSNTCA